MAQALVAARSNQEHQGPAVAVIAAPTGRRDIIAQGRKVATIIIQKAKAAIKATSTEITSSSAFFWLHPF